MIGSKFGKLTIISESEKLKPGIRRVSCLCDCGNTTVVTYSSVKSGNTKSCGCMSSRVAARPTQYYGTPTYAAWLAMKARCTCKKSEGWKYYGGKGICVCERWNHSFLNFLEDMGDRPQGFELDRIDSNGNYEPGNCRWVSKKQNSRNKSNNVFLEYEGVSRTVGEWAEIKGIKYITLYSRIFDYKWDICRALSEPSFKGKNQSFKP